jgi:hypothetical protein
MPNQKEVTYQQQEPVRDNPRQAQLNQRPIQQDRRLVQPLNNRLGPKAVASSRYPGEQPRSVIIENVGANPTGNARRFGSFLGAKELTDSIQASVNESLRDNFGEQEDTKNLNAIQEESESVYSSARSSLTTPPRKEAEKKPGDYDSLSEYWQAQAQSRKTRLMSISQESGRSTRSSILSSPPTNIFSSRQQELLSSLGDMRKGSVQYGSLPRIPNNTH